MNWRDRTFSAATVLLVALSGCLSHPEPTTGPAGADRADCMAAPKRLADAAAYFETPANAGLTFTVYWRQLGALAPAALADRVEADMAATGQALDPLRGATAALIACRGSGASAEAVGRTAIETGPGLALARDAAARAAALAETYDRAALAIEADPRATKPGAAAPPPELAPASIPLGYRVKLAGMIYAQPHASAKRIAALRKNQRVTAATVGAGATPPAGWVAIVLNDASVGYVESDRLRPVAPNPSARSAGAPGDIPPPAVADRTASLRQASQGLAGKLEAMRALLDGAASVGVPGRPVS